MSSLLYSDSFFQKLDSFNIGCKEFEIGSQAFVIESITFEQLKITSEFKYVKISYDKKEGFMNDKIDLPLSPQTKIR